nr:hypothetical protein [Tanacetum cinerariifolium]
MIITKFDHTQKFVDEIGELRGISGHVLGAVRVQIPENNLDNLHSSVVKDGTLETVDPQDILGSFLSADKDLLCLKLLTGTLFLDALVVVILVKGHEFPTIVKVLPVGYDPLALVVRFTPVEDTIGLLETTFDKDVVLMGEFPVEVTGSVNLTFLVLFIEVTAISLSPKSLMQVQSNMVIHTVKTEMMKLVVEIECVYMNVDEFDKETGSSDDLQPKQAELSCVHALNKPHLYVIHVILNVHVIEE